MGSSQSDSEIYAGMVGYPFITKCPACKNNDDIQWVHSSDDGLETIDNEGNIHCQKCSLNRFLMELRYDCGKHNNEYREPNWRRTIYAISQLATCENMPDDVCDYIIERIRKYKK